jgi:hypothetical protein
VRWFLWRRANGRYYACRTIDAAAKSSATRSALMILNGQKSLSTASSSSAPSCATPIRGP